MKFDVIIIGGGPAGITAAIYLAREGKNVAVFEKNMFGGQIVNSPSVKNIPGFISVKGSQFANELTEQALVCGANLFWGEEVLSAERMGGSFLVKTSENEHMSDFIIIATGTKHRRLGLSNEEDLIGNGVHFCATCDGDFYRSKTVAVIGGGNSAFVEAQLLAGICKKVTIYQNLDHFTAEKMLSDSVLSMTNVNTVLSAGNFSYVTENGILTGISYTDGTGTQKTDPVDGIFLAIGLEPDDPDRFENIIDVNDAGYFVNTNYARYNGVYAVGDCKDKTLRQVVTACADGANAAYEICHLHKRS